MRKIEKADFHLRVTPSFWVTDNEAHRRNLCEQIAKAIRRHVDDVASVGIEWETAATCSYCGAAWTEDSPDYNGGCCDADEAHNPSLRAPSPFCDECGCPVNNHQLRCSHHETAH